MGPGDRFVESNDGNRLFIKGAAGELIEVANRQSHDKEVRKAKIAGWITAVIVFIILMVLYFNKLSATSDFRNLTGLLKCFALALCAVLSACLAGIAWVIGAFLFIVIRGLFTFEWRKTWHMLREAG